MALPEILKSALEKKTSELSSLQLRNFSQKLSHRYRDYKKNNGAFMSCYEDYLAYLTTRMPATYGAIARVLSTVQAKVPSIGSLLDIGSGPGTGFWAAREYFNLNTVTLVEKEKGLISLGQALIQESGLSADWLQRDVETHFEFHAHDLVLMAYSLGELSESSRLPLLQHLWKAANQVLVLIEPGTPAGFKRILEARNLLTEWGGHIIGPCTHSGSCPLKEGDWCHFAERIPRTLAHQRAKQAELNYEDEKFSYIVFCKEPLQNHGFRVLRHPQKRSGHVELTLCSEKGIENQIISRKQKQIYSTARKLEWGSLLNLNNSPI